MLGKVLSCKCCGICCVRRGDGLHSEIPAVMVPWFVRLEKFTRRCLPAGMHLALFAQSKRKVAKAVRALGTILYEEHEPDQWMK